MAPSSFIRNVALASVLFYLAFKLGQHFESTGHTSTGAEFLEQTDDANPNSAIASRSSKTEFEPYTPHLTDLKDAWRGSPATPAELTTFFQEASRNLTIWKRNLFGITEKTHAKYLRTPSLVWTPNLFDIAPSTMSCPPGTSLRLIGVEKSDGGKWVCGVTELVAPCVVFSLGSNGNYAFENSILELTPCMVYTFDCTMANRGGGQTLSERHQFHLKCIGSEEKALEDPNFLSLPQAMARVGVDRVDLFKMDIEGFEYDVMATWGTLKEGLDAGYLPMQLIIEVHIEHFYFGTPYHKKDDLSNLMWPKQNRMSLPEIALFFSHLADLGYGVVFLEKNPGCLHCAEFVLLRVQ